jgi:hypothetical protein
LRRFPLGDVTSVTPDRLMVRAGVLGGLVLCATAGFDADIAVGELPGAALGSTAVLRAERVGVLFAVWLFVFVVLGQAWAGRLPTEISGRGVKYADSEGTRQSARETETALRQLNSDLRRTRVELMRVEELAHGEQETRIGPDGVEK